MNDNATIKTLDLKEEVIKEKDNIKLVKITRKVEICNTQGTSKRYDVRYKKDDKFITSIAGANEEEAIKLFNKINDN